MKYREGKRKRDDIGKSKAVNGYPRRGYPLIEAGTNSQITRISGSTNMYFMKKMEKMGRKNSQQFQTLFFHKRR